MIPVNIVDICKTGLTLVKYNLIIIDVVYEYIALSTQDLIHDWYNRILI